MNMDSVNKWLTFVANLGVIAGIVFLAFELRQTQDIAKAQIRNEISLAAQERSRADMELLAEIVVRFRSGEPLSALDLLRTEMWINSVLSYLENLSYQTSQGLYDEAPAAAQMAAFRWMRDLPGFERQFCEGQAWDPAFVDRVKSIFPEVCE